MSMHPPFSEVHGLPDKIYYGWNKVYNQCTNCFYILCILYNLYLILSCIQSLLQFTINLKWKKTLFCKIIVSSSSTDKFVEESDCEYTLKEEEIEEEEEDLNDEQLEESED